MANARETVRELVKSVATADLDGPKLVLRLQELFEKIEGVSFSLEDLQRMQQRQLSNATKEQFDEKEISDITEGR